MPRKAKKLPCEFVNSNNEEVFSYTGVSQQVGGLLKLDIYDLYKNFEHFGKWCDSKGYGEKDPEGKKRNSSKIWYAEYKEDENGEKKSPPYLTLFDIFIEEHPDWFPLEYVNDWNDYTKCFNMDSMIESVKNSEKYTNLDKEGLLIKCLEKIKEIYGNEICMMDERA